MPSQQRRVEETQSSHQPPLRGWWLVKSSSLVSEISLVCVFISRWHVKSSKWRQRLVQKEELKVNLKVFHYMFGHQSQPFINQYMLHLYSRTLYHFPSLCISKSFVYVTGFGEWLLHLAAVLAVKL